MSILQLNREGSEDLSYVVGTMADVYAGHRNFHVSCVMEGCRERVPNLLQIYLQIWCHPLFQQKTQELGAQQALGILLADLENVSTWREVLSLYGIDSQ